MRETNSHTTALTDDPLGALWRDTTRPLNWQAWAGTSATAQAVHRFLLCRELQSLDHDPVWSQAPWPWRHTHRELLELKACAGHSR